MCAGWEQLLHGDCVGAILWTGWNVDGPWRMLVEQVGMVETDCHRWPHCPRSSGVMEAEWVVEMVAVDGGGDFLAQVV